MLLAIKAQPIWRPAPLSQPDGDVGRIGRFRHCKARADAASRTLDKHPATTMPHMATKKQDGDAAGATSHLLQSEYMSTGAGDM